jgi:hypothetical protein
VHSFVEHPPAGGHTDRQPVKPKSDQLETWQRLIGKHFGQEIDETLKYIFAIDITIIICVQINHEAGMPGYLGESF